MTDTRALEDRVLILKDQVAELNALMEKAGFNPDQPRGKGGKWSDSGGGWGSIPEAEADRIQDARWAGDLSLEDKAIRAYSFPEDTIVYRGVSGGYAQSIRGVKVGSTIEFDQVTSTTTDRRIAELFADGDAAVLFVINAPKGAVGARARVFVHPDELDSESRNEWELPSGSRVRVDSITPSKISGSDGGVIIEASLLPDVAKAGFNPDQPRGKGGKWASAGGGGQGDLLSRDITAFHGTSRRYLAKIKSEGIKPQGGTGADAWLISVSNLRDADVSQMVAKLVTTNIGKVYLAMSPQLAWDYAKVVSRHLGSRPVVLEVRVPRADWKDRTGFDTEEENPDPHFQPARTFSGVIKPEWIVGTVRRPKPDVLSRLQAKAEAKLKKDAGDVTLYAVAFPDMAKAGFDPNEPRDGGGKWSAGGGDDNTQMVHVKDERGWLHPTRINEAVNLAYKNIKPMAKEALSHAVATALTYHSKSGPDYDAVQASVVHLANRMEISAEQARTHVIGALTKLRELRVKHLGKAEQDPVIKQIDKAIKRVEKIELPQDLTKLEDRVLELRDQVDTLTERIK